MYTRTSGLGPSYKEATVLVAEAYVLCNAKQYVQAIACLDQVLAFYPTYTGAWFGKALALHGLGQYQEASACYDQALVLDPKNVAVWNNKGKALQNLGQFKEAVLCYERALALDPKSKEAWNNKASALLNLGQYKEAIACYDQALVLNPKNVAAWNNKGLALQDLDQYKEAIACFDHVLALNPEDTAAWNNKGMALLNLGQYKEAIACFDYALALDPKLKEAWLNKGLALNGLGQYKEAIACFDHALALDPKDTYAWNYKGLAFDKLGQCKEAIACYDQALAFDPKYEQAHINKAEALKKLSQLAPETLPKAPMTAAGIRPYSVKIPEIPERKAPAGSLTAGMQHLSLSSSTSAEKKEDKILFATSFTIPYDELKLSKELGRGGFGVVHQAIWRHREVAVKQLLASALSPTAVEEFKNESAIMAKLRSRDIVQFYGCCVSPRYCIVMEYMPKGSLFSLLQSSQSLEWPIRYRLVTDMACGLAFLHAENILHRDLKSLNVLLDENFRAKLSDFGLSKVKSETRTTTSKAQAVGTLAWTAPELFTPKTVYTQKADIYSFGITIWEVASRQLPFADAATPALVPMWVAQGERPEIPKDCPKKLASLIRFCWQGKPEQRPSADQVVAYLRSDKEEFTPAPAAPSYRINLDSGAGASASYRGNFSSRPG